MRRRILTIVSGLLVSASVASAASIFAPVSIGMAVKHNGPRAAALAGADITVSDSIYFPMNNPAGWFSTGRTRYMAGAYLGLTSAKDRHGSESADDLMFPNMAISVPFYRSLGIGMSYNTITDYRFLMYRDSTTSLPGIDDSLSSYPIRERFQGNGGLARVSLNIGARVRPWLSVGLGMDYYFGTTERLWKMNFTQGTISSSGMFIRDEYSGMGLRAGALYNPGKRWTLGASFTLPTTLSVSSLKKVDGGDSTVFPERNFGLPAAVELGLSHTAGRFRAMGKGSVELWKNASRDHFTQFTYDNAVDLGIGLEVLPLRGPLDPWYQKWVYRFGGHVGNNYAEVNGNPLNIFGLGLGVGIPIRAHGGFLDLAVTFDVRGNEAKNGAYERVIGLQLGFGSAESWFSRRKQ